MKRFLTVFCILALSFSLSARAVTRDEALDIARGFTGAEAALIDTEEDNGVYEFDFDGGSVRYDVDVRTADGAVLEFETTYKNAPRAAEFELSEAGAQNIALERYPGSSFDLLLSERDDGAAVYEAFILTGNGVPAAVTLSAGAGDLIRTKLYPAAVGVLPAAEIARIAAIRSGENISSLELSYDESGYDYEGSAGGFDFEIDAFSGSIEEWEVDD